MSDIALLAAALGEEEPLDEDVRALLGRLEEFGITRLAETTRLDRIGVRTHSATKPGTSDVISIYSGKGLSVSESVRTAIMECLERTGSLWNLSELIVASPAQASAIGDVVVPSAFTEASRRLEPGQAIAWVWADQLGTTKRSLVPAQLAFNGRAPQGVGILPFVNTTSNGLGAAFDPDKAATHGLRELIERDVVSCVELLASDIHFNQLSSLARAFTISLGSDRFRDRLDHVLRVDLQSLPETAAGIVSRLLGAGLSVEIRALPNDLGVPCFAAATAEERGMNKVLATAGYAAGYPIERTLVRALLELCQSRATHSQGGREDDSVVLEKCLQRTVDRSGWQFNQSLPGLAFDDVLAYFLPGEDALACYAERLQEAGLGPMYIYRCQPYPGIHVARLLVPEVETWHASAGESRLGLRMERARQNQTTWRWRTQRRIDR
jgi:ribosomal protein S12 methylthiotransferase accessory factor YcaO